MNLKQISVHESGHAVALLANGQPVAALYVNNYSGSGGCRPLKRWKDISPRITLLAAAAGAAADRLLADGPGEMSPSDFDVAGPHLELLDPKEQRQLFRHAEQFAVEQQLPILALAAELRQAGHMEAAAIRGACCATPLLVRFASLYPLAQVAPADGPYPNRRATLAPLTRTVRLRGLQRVSCGAF